jgi:hypothetical protein
MPKVAVGGLLERIEALLRADVSDLDAYLLEVEVAQLLQNCIGRLHCKLISLDGKSLPRVKDLARFFAGRVMDFAIPRGELQAAQYRDLAKNTCQMSRPS